MNDAPKTQVNVRLSLELQSRVADYRFANKLPTVNAAYEAVIEAGLSAGKAAADADGHQLTASDVHNMDAFLGRSQWSETDVARMRAANAPTPSGSTRHAAREIMAERGAGQSDDVSAAMGKVQVGPTKRSGPFFKPQKGKGK